MGKYAINVIVFFKSNLILVIFMKKFLLLLFFISQRIICDQWSDLLEKYHVCMGQETYHFLCAQYKSFSLGQAPLIADQKIKDIPIVESNEKLVDLKEINHSRIKLMEGEYLIKAHQYKEDIDPRAENYSMIRKSVFDSLIRAIDILDKIAPEFGYEKGEMEIYLFEGLRDIATQKVLFDSCKQRIAKENPNLTQEQLYNHTCKYVSPYINNIPTHSTGAAIDIALYSNKKGVFCDMARFNHSGQIAATFSTDLQITNLQKKNRLFLLIAATKAGLTNYLFEFWHYSLGDRYAAYWRETDSSKQIAIYGAK